MLVFQTTLKMYASYAKGKKSTQSSNHRECSLSRPKTLGKMTPKDTNQSSVPFSGGKPILPPIPSYDFSYDPWIKSKLMKTGSSSHNQGTLKKYS